MFRFFSAPLNNTTFDPNLDPYNPDPLTNTGMLIGIVGSAIIGGGITLYCMWRLYRLCRSQSMLEDPIEYSEARGPRVVQVLNNEGEEDHVEYFYDNRGRRLIIDSNLPEISANSSENEESRSNPAANARFKRVIEVPNRKDEVDHIERIYTNGTRLVIESNTPEISALSEVNEEDELNPQAKESNLDTDREQELTIISLGHSR